MKRLLITAAVLLVLSPSLIATPPLTDCYTAFNWEQACCADSSAEIARWTYCRCTQSGGTDCVAQAYTAHNAALSECQDASSECPPAFYWFP